MHDDSPIDRPPPDFGPDDDLANLVPSDPAPRSLLRVDRISPNAWVCPFLQAIDEDDVLHAPVESPDPANRCVALTDPVPQSRPQNFDAPMSRHLSPLDPQLASSTHGTQRFDICGRHRISLAL